MEKQFADEKMKKYLRLMRLRRNFVLSVFLVPSVIIVVLMLARVDEKGFVAQRFEIQSPLIEPNLRRNLGKWST
ncbi:hypothetical protein ACLD0V_17035 [Acinetobacter baumannii]